MYRIRCLVGFLITLPFSLILWKRKMFDKNKIINFQIKGCGVIKLSPYTAHFFKLDYLQKSKGFKKLLPLRLEPPTIKDPINLIFIGFSPEDLGHFLTVHGNWKKIGTSMQYFFVEGKWKPLISSYEYVAENSPEEERYHIRIFEEKKNGMPIVLAAAHYEYFDELAQDHIVTSWQAGEELVLKSFSSFKQVRTDKITQPSWRNCASDGKATMILKS